MERALLSATVDFSAEAQMETPEELVDVQFCISVFEDPEVAKVGETPATGVPAESRSVMVIVEASTPSLVTGPLPVMVE